MSEEYMESLARAYREKLEGSSNPLSQALTDVINEQIYLLSRLKKGKLVGYLISLKECCRSLVSDNKKPSQRALPREGGIGRILSLELELFALLDSEEGVNPKLLEYENRFTALLGFLLK